MKCWDCKNLHCKGDEPCYCWDKWGEKFYITDPDKDFYCDEFEEREEE